MKVEGAEIEEWDRASGELALDPAKLAFCAKESVYKADYPLTKRFLDFHDVEVAFDFERETFIARIGGVRSLHGCYGTDASTAARPRPPCPLADGPECDRARRVRQPVECADHGHAPAASHCREKISRMFAWELAETTPPPAMKIRLWNRTG